MATNTLPTNNPNFSGVTDDGSYGAGTGSMASTNPASNLPPVQTNPTTPPPATPATPPAQTIDGSSLGNSTALTYPQTQSTQQGSHLDANGNLIVQSPSSFTSSISGQYTPPPDNPTLSAAEQNQNDLTQKLSDLQNQDLGKSAATQQAYQNSGVYAAQQNMTSLYNNLQTRTAQFNQQEENALEGPGSGQSQNIALGAAGLVQRQAAVELGVDTAVYNAAANNYTTAKAIADQTIAFQFAPIEQQIANTQNFLDINKTNLSVGQQKQADIMQGSLQLQQAQIDQAKTDRTQSLNIMNQAAQSGLTDPATLKQIANSNPGDAASLAAPYLSYSYLQNLYMTGYLKSPPVPPGSTPVSSSTSQTPAVANNNPGNLKDPKTGQFQQFPSMQAGFLALQQDLYAKGTGTSTTSLNANSTLSQFASVYAPSSDGNDPTSYAKNIATQLGVPTSTKIGDLVNDPNKLQQFANAVSKNEDVNANAIVNGQQPIGQTQPEGTQSNLDKANNVIASAPLPFRADLSTITSTGDIFSTATPGSNSANWASANGIKVITPSEAGDVKNIDTAISALQNIQDNFTALAPTTRGGQVISNAGAFLGKLFGSDFGGKADAYNSTIIPAAQGALSQVTGSSALKPFTASVSESSLPRIANGSLNPFGRFNSDTLSEGLDKLNILRQSLNSALKSILPNSPGVAQSQPIAPSQPTKVQYQGQVYNVDAQGNMTLSTQ